MSFATPWLLLALLIVPAVLAFLLWIERRHARYAVAFTNIDVLASVAVARRPTWRSWIPVALLLLALAFAATALARPNAPVSTPLSRATVVLLVDVSGSMRADDVKPTRLGAAQAAMLSFLDHVPKHVRVGLVSFSTSAQLVVPPTTNREDMRQGVAYLEPEAGTAIGEGEQDAVNTVLASVGRNAPRKNGHIPAAIVMLSDGAQTRGVLSPLQGAQLAKNAGIPIYTIALGTRNGVLRDTGGFGFGFGGGGSFPVPPDPETLAQIAQYTGGIAYQAQSAEKVQAVYQHLSNTVTTHQQRREISSWFAGAAAFFLLGSLAAGKATGERLP